MWKRVALQGRRQADGFGLAWLRADGDGTSVCESPAPVAVESVGPGLRDAARTERGYDTFEVRSADSAVGTARLTDPHGNTYAVQDRWERVDELRWRVERRLEVLEAVPGSGARLHLDVLASDGEGFSDFRYFAPGAMYDLNDLNQDGVDDYADAQTLFYREDRLTARSVLAHHAASGTSLSLSRDDRPEFDPTPERAAGQLVYLQATDIGSLGIAPAETSGRACVLSAAYPFVERDRSHAIDVTTRPGWGTYWPIATGDVLTASYVLSAAPVATPQQALAALWRERMRDLAPRPVQLDAPLDEITHYRLDALLDYYAEDPTGSAAGFVTNCHPQDGRQLGNVVQYGFTGQNILNAYNLLRADATGSAPADREARRKALRVIDFYVEDAERSPYGLVHGLYTMDRRRYGSWWTGLLLPLAYAEPGDDLEALMGPLYEHLRPVIERLAGREGTYLRCLAEEYDSLLQAMETEGVDPARRERWLRSARTFGNFLVDAQNDDGSWFRGYDFAGQPLTEPDFWFGQTDVQRKSSTATVVPFLLRLHGSTGDERYLRAARTACDFVYTAFVDGLKFNGGIHDSMYAKPQLVDHESIIFAFRALLETSKAIGDQELLDRATTAAWIVCSWVFLWDVPLPEESTYARFGFRSTGWAGCDAPGAGYIHPMGIIAAPDLVELSRLTGQAEFAGVAQLLVTAANENVALPGKDWGYARPGLQEEGQLVSWCWADDPMFTDTEFGGRLKGEGNKTCFPWISAVTVWAHQELVARYGTADVPEAVGVEAAG